MRANSLNSKLKAILAGTLIMLGAFFAYSAINTSSADAAGCSGNSVIKCGVWSVSEMRQKYNSDYTKGTKAIYSYMGVSSNMVNNARVVKGKSYKNGEVKVDGKVVAKNASTSGRYYIKGSTKHVAGDGTVFYTRPTQISFVTKSVWETFVFLDKNGKFIGAVLLDCGNPLQATPVTPKPKPQPPKPVYTCASLSRLKQDNPNKYVFVGKSKVANGAKHKGFTFDFGDGSNKQYVSVQRTSGAYGYGEVKHTYAKPGNYTVKVTAHFTVNGKTVTDGGGDCTKPVTIPAPKKPAPKPYYSCTSLTAVKKDRDTYTFTAKSTAKNGAKYTGFTIAFGDGTSKYVASTSGTASVTHDYVRAGTYKAQATARFSVDGAAKTNTNKNCLETVTVKPAPKKPAPKTPGVSIDKKVRADKSTGMTVEEALEQARNFRPKGPCTTVMTPAVHVETGARYTFTSGCLPQGWVAERVYRGTPHSNSNRSTGWVEHAKVEVNKPFTYRLIIKNTGETTLKNAKVTDQAPTGVQFLSANKGKTTAKSWSYTIPSLAVGASISVEIEAKATKYVEGRIVNTACVDAREVPGDKDDCDDATVEVEKPKKEKPPVEKYIEVCVLETKEYPVTIKEKDFDRKLHSMNPEDCEEVVKEPKEIEVCVLETKEYPVTIKETEFDSELHSMNPADCEEAPEVPETPEVPEELPVTGLTGAINSVLGLGSITAASYYYLVSRRNS